jgi:hypothetical protein
MFVLCSSIILHKWTFFFRRKQLLFLFMCISISFSNVYLFLRRKGLALFFVCSSIGFKIFDLFLRRKGLALFLVCISIIDQNLCFLIGRERLSISFHCCRICFQILFENTFSMLFNLNWFSSAENSCNLHAIIAILLIFFHKCLVFLLPPSSFIYIIVW